MKVYRAFQDKRKILEVAGKKSGLGTGKKGRNKSSPFVRFAFKSLRPRLVAQDAAEASFCLRKLLSDLFWGWEFFSSYRGDFWISWRQLEPIEVSMDWSTLHRIKVTRWDRIGSDQLAWLFLILIHTWIDPGSIQDSDRDCFHFQSGVARKNFDWGLELGSNPGRKVVVHWSRFYLNVVRWSSRLWKKFFEVNCFIYFFSFSGEKSLKSVCVQ